METVALIYVGVGVIAGIAILISKFREGGFEEVCCALIESKEIH